MTKKRLSLNAKLLLMLLVAGAGAFGLYSAVESFGLWAIQHWYMEPDAAAERETQCVESFSTYVIENDVSSNDLNAIETWAKEQKYVHLVLYRDDEASIDAWNWGSEVLVEEDADWGYLEGGSRIWPLQFADGTFQVYLTEYSEDQYYDLVSYGSLIIAVLFFISLMLIYNRHIINGVRQLVREVEAISDGDLQRNIRIKGAAELATLGAEMSHMRDSIIEQMQYEKEARQANSDLLTAISHDLRTPLTTLLGYLSLAKQKQYETPEELQSYLDISYSKCEQMKQLSDELFEYFLVFSKRDIELNLEEYDAGIILDQLLGEHQFDLENKGYRILKRPLEVACRIRIDPQYLKRVFDNLFSNVEKHADKSQRVVLMTQVQTDTMQLHICIANHIPEQPKKVESTKIGLQTCEKIMQQMGGQFLRYLERDGFTAEVILPIVSIERPGLEP